MTVLVLTEECDPTADRVISELNRREVPVFRCDTSWFPSRLCVDAHLDGGDWSGVLLTPHRVVGLRDIRSVWYRRPTVFSFPEGMSGPERQHAGWEAKFGLGGVLMSLPALQVNHPSREADACYKPFQLATAARCGLTVPDTIVTNDPLAVRPFADRVEGGRVAVKLMGSNVIFEEGGPKVCYTHPLDDHELTDLSSVGVTAHLFQEWIDDKAYEVRVTAVGDALFAASIHTSSDAARVDWRSDFAALTYGVVNLPSQVAAGIRRYLSAMNLRYGAFDFVVTSKDDYIFLECNPGGQFGWIEGNTTLPITRALADLLERGQQ
ncbi:MAG: ATP-grasp ribosomal peptide maturase [Pseudonocardiaceae bacterium]